MHDTLNTTNKLSCISFLKRTNCNCYGGTVAEISALGEDVSNVNGLTVITRSPTGKVYTVFEETAVTINLYHISKAKVLVVDNGRSSAKQRKTVLHEVGHSFGWFGESYVSSNVMYYTDGTVTTLSTNDKRHLAQVY